MYEWYCKVVKGKQEVASTKKPTLVFQNWLKDNKPKPTLVYQNLLSDSQTKFTFITNLSTKLAERQTNKYQKLLLK